MNDVYGLSIPERLEDACTPARCALVIYDMQVGIVSQIHEGQDILIRCQQLLLAAREKGFRVFLPNRLAGVGQLHRAMIWQKQSDPAKTRPMMTQGSEAWEIVPELAPQADEIVIDKITMSAFESTFLNIAMRDAHLEAFMIAGIALEIGIEPTVRHGLDLNFLPIVVADACGSKTAELKQRSLATLTDTGEIKTLNSAEAVALMRR
jgi:biuret amidohydrolase